MVSFLDNQRGSGILAHLSSLPSEFGIGDIGDSAHRFIDYLESGGQKYWQILPTVPTSLVFDSSPYMSSSAFAGSPLLISPEILHKDGLLTRQELQRRPSFSPYTTEYEKVTTFKAELLERAFARFDPRADPAYLKFCELSSWLEDYALYMSIKELLNGKPWYEWPEPLVQRDQTALADFRKREARRIHFFCFVQYLFFSQWRLLKDHAREKSIQIIGDIPIYIGLDSADVWANQKIFELDPRTHQPLRVSGVPPDYFSKTGQRWGNPLYRWNSPEREIREKLLSWWGDRLEAVFQLVDIARIDHFRGFESYWTIPAKEETAVKGKWVKGPGAALFKRLQEKLGRLNIIAEDLGHITPDVIKLRDKLGFPGMKVLQFAFDGNLANQFLPYNFTSKNCVIYTGTHDNDTTTGWFLSERLNDAQRRLIKRFANRELFDDSTIHRDFIHLALSSTADLAIIPLQDVLGFGSDCRMNIPGEPEGNWRWRCAEEFLTPDLASWLKDITTRFGR